MKYQKFTITNFRGIENLEIDLSRSPKQPVFTLVGLNESGKTTILEAINQFSSNPDSLDALNIQGYRIKDPHTLIPIARKANFNGSVGLTTKVQLEEDDWIAIEKGLRKQHKLQVERTGDYLKVEQNKRFINSQYNSAASKNKWFSPFRVKTKQAKKWRSINNDEFKTLAEILKPRFPSILYFPNFLFDFPNRIYIDEPPDDGGDIHAFYKSIIQDILDSLNNGLTIQTHILDRAKSGKTNDGRALNAVLLEMSREVTRRVLGAWSRIFRRQMTDKRIVITCEADSEGKYFLEFKVEDNDGDFLVTERSLGFRWFFVFLLLTEYRGFRKTSNRNLLFLFDEPASNLHSTAQTLLLESFNKLSESCVILYTTHSHHLINADWLEGTFVVKNEGIDYDSTEDEFSAKKTRITATRYREFVSKNPSQTTYFKPILDVLQWAPSNLEFIPDAVFVEGKNDFYTLNYLSFLAGRSGETGYLPTGGAGSKESLIALYVGWGRHFIILLDADGEGEKQRKRYIDLFGEWIGKRIFTLSDIDKNWSGRALEKILSDNDRRRIVVEAGYRSEEYTKKIFNRAVQELLAMRRPVELTKPGGHTVTKLLNGVDVLSLNSKPDIDRSKTA